MRVSRVGRAVVAGGAALGLLLGAAACGGEVDKGKLVSKLKSEDDFKELSDKQVNCVADVIIKYADKDDVIAYTEGKKTSDEVGDSDNEEAAQKLVECVGA